MRIVYTASARGRLRRIVHFIHTNHSEERAKKFRKRILDRTDELLEQPLKGHPVPPLEFMNAGHRSLSDRLRD